MSVYRSIASDLSRRITEGEFALGDSLPPELALATHYGVSRGTLRSALALLERQGAVAPRQGSGWTIRSTLHRQGFEQLRSFAQWARSRGMEPGGLVVESTRRTPTLHEAAVLRLAEPASLVLHVTRIRSLDGRSVMLERAVYPPWMSEVIESIAADEPSVVQAMQRRGVVSVHADHSIDAVAASSDDARLLAVRRGGPLLRVRRTTFARDGRAIEHGDDRYLAGAMAFQVHSSVEQVGMARSG